LLGDIEMTRVLVDKQYRHGEDRDDSGDDYFMALEHFIFTSAFIARKLKDAQRLSDEIETELSVRVKRYGRRKRGRSLQDFWFDKAWVTSRYSFEELSLWKICGLLLHSVEFMTWGWETKPDVSILFSSDHTLHRCIYEMSLVNYMECMERVCVDEIGYCSKVWSDKVRDHVIIEKPRAGSAKHLQHSYKFEKALVEAGLEHVLPGGKASLYLSDAARTEL
jgi:hypothetical protein